jgi:hypothetical protein
MTKLTVAFRNFVNAPKNSTFAHRVYLCVLLCGSKSKQRQVSHTGITGARSHTREELLLASLCLSTCISSGPTGRIFVKFYIGDFY